MSSALSRRSVLQLAGAAALPLSSGMLWLGPAQAAARGNADHRLQCQSAVVRSDRRVVGGQSDHPVDLSGDLRSLYRSGARSVVQARPADQMGLERRPHQDHDGAAQGRDLARRLAGDARRRRLVAAARRRSEGRQPDPVRLVQGRQLQDRRQHHHRRRAGIRADLVQVDGLPHRLCPAEGLLREGRRGRFREGADRLRPVQGRRLRAQRLPAAQGASRLLGSQARLRHGGVQIRHRSHQPRRRDRVGRIGRHVRDSLRGVRPPEGEAGLGRADQAGVRHRDDLHHRHRPDARPQCPPRRQSRDRQEGDRRPAAEGLRRSDLDAGSAGLRRLRSLDQGRPTIRSWRRACWPRAASRRRSRSSSPSRRRAASSRRITR